MLANGHKRHQTSVGLTLPLLHSCNDAPRRTHSKVPGRSHKSAGICDLRQELAFGTQRGLRQTRNSYKPFVFIFL